MEVNIIDGNFICDRYRKLLRRNFGKDVGDKLELHPVEVGYLLLKGIVTLKDGDKTISFAEFIEKFSEKEGFLPYFFVYCDLRDRGRKAAPVENYIVANNIYLPVSERKKVFLKDLNEFFDEHGAFILAVVDEESEITYYRVYKPKMAGKTKGIDKKIEGYFAGDRVLTDDLEIFSRFFFGSEKDGMVALSILESLYMIEEGILTLNLSLNEFRAKAEAIESNFLERYEVYRDLREKGLVVKTGFKFGADFRVYEEIEDVSQLPHSKYLVSIVSNDGLNLQDISRAVRLAHSVRKKMVFTFKDGGWTYLCLERVKV
ncbi:tRNA intron endonuclease [Archaeoglobus sulfaticallidus PM70-1]|uniref:tRNA intron endonuclease n=1 Tax=Archaeoglobus sulfaticallidus PM70-1 TaxID=387631 RepID=N0BDW4_9EURY|nr:tRNA-intron lyase [Archaeoglobus sulfaticallidus]AGK61819.1 tRNA intron endonuclease [Archaeoglobus sulfaticallidus PM70-1]